jgi:hypothetical protein
MNTTNNLPRDDSGRLIAYAWPGGYPVIYLDKYNEVLCPDCANESETNDNMELPIAYFVHYEGPAEYCCQCSKPIESAYGDPESQEEDND